MELQQFMIDNCRVTSRHFDVQTTDPSPEPAGPHLEPLTDVEAMQDLPKEVPTETCKDVELGRRKWPTESEKATSKLRGSFDVTSLRRNRSKIINRRFLMRYEVACLIYIKK